MGKKLTPLPKPRADYSARTVMLLLGSLSNNGGNGKANGKKATGLY